MQKNVLITGGSSGLGKAIVEELASENFEMYVLGRNKEKLAQLQGPNIHVIHGDATDERLVKRVFADLKPVIVLLNAGATPIMASLEEHSWDSFNTVWNTDVRAGLYGIQAALNTPLTPGSRVVVVTSGAAMVGAPLSGSYAGAKRMLWFMVQYANEIAQKKELGISFQTLLPMQMIGETDLAQTIAGAYACKEGVTTDKYIENRYGAPITAAEYASHVCTFLSNPEGYPAVAYGIRKDTGLKMMNY
jgi:NAD(P)-dependent dehydrogenase (short-subunit alcohol dehydrogenase family)